MATDDTNIQFLLGKIDGKLDVALRRLDDHETRIRAAEKKQWWLAGAAVTAGFVLNHLQPLTAILPKV